MFSYATNELGKYLDNYDVEKKESTFIPFQQISKESIKTRNNLEPPQMILFLEKYSNEIRKHPKKYGMLLECQAYSHI